MSKKHKKKAKPRPPPRRASSRAAKKARNKAYEAEIARLQVEIAHLQAWVKETGARIVILFEGRDAAGKGGMIKRLTERVCPRVFRVVALPAPSDRAEDPALHAALHRAAARRRRGADLRPQLVQPPRRRAGDGLLHRDAARRFLQEIPHLEALITECGITLLKYFLDRRRGRAGAPLPPAHRRPVRQWKLSPDGPRDLSPLVGLHAAPTTR